MDLNDYIINEVTELKVEKAKLETENRLLKSFITKHIGFRLYKDGKLGIFTHYAVSDNVVGPIKEYLIKDFGIDKVDGE